MSSFYFHLIHVSYLYVYDTPFLISCNSKGCENLLLLCLHYLCLIFFHMVIAKQMKHTMGNKKSKFSSN